MLAERSSIIVENNNYSAKITFNGFVCWNKNSEKIVEIQNIFERCWFYFFFGKNRIGDRR